MIRLLTALALFALSGPAEARQKTPLPVEPPAPGPQIVAVTDWSAQGVLIVQEAVAESVPRQKVTVVEMDGIKREVVTTEFVTATVTRRRMIAVKDCEFATAGGKKLTADQAKALAPSGALVALSPVGANVDQAFLKVLKDDVVLVLVKNPGPPELPAPPRPMPRPRDD
jgi:hypothetical protein